MSASLASPALLSPASAATLAGVATPLTRYRVAGTGSDPVTLRLTVDGALLADPGAGAAVIGAGSGAMLIAGTVDQVNATLATLAVLATQPGQATVHADLLDAAGRRVDQSVTAMPVYAAATPDAVGAAISYSTGTLSLTGAAIDGLAIGLTAGSGGEPAPALVLVADSLGAGSALRVTGTPARVAIAGEVDWAGSVSLSHADAAITLARGAVLVNTGAITLDASAAAITGPGAVRNQGRIEVVSGAPRIAADISGAGTIAIDAGAVLTVAGAVSADQTILLDGTLDLASPGSMQGQITSFAAGDRIIVHAAGVEQVGFSATDASHGTLSVVAGGQVVASLHLTGRYDASAFTVTQSAETTDAADATVQITLRPAAQEAAGTTGAAATTNVYRFFDTRSGTSFLTQDGAERATILQTRPDFTYEGVAMRAFVSPAADADTVPVFRFFDTQTGTHFFTASTAERDATLATRPDLVWEQSATLYEHAVAHAGDVAVYRYFDTVHGSHLFTADAAERSSIAASRPDLRDEGVAFYAPA